MMENVYKELTVGWPVPRGGFPPALADSELLTMEIIGEIEGRHGDRAIWRYVNSHGRGCFPLPIRSISLTVSRYQYVTQ